MHMKFLLLGQADCKLATGVQGLRLCLPLVSREWKHGSNSSYPKGPKDPIIRYLGYGQQLSRLIFGRVYDY